MSSNLTLTDLFCGAGGSSTGAIAVPGVRVRMAANHWQLAVDTHNTNHPEADHSCADLSQVDPRYFPTTDLLWASPECFTAGHLVTTARGQVPIEDVQVGDFVLTHLGRWRPVVRIQNRQSSTVVVSGQGHTGIETTPTHRFWARTSTRRWMGRPEQYRRQYGAPGWIQANDLLAGSALWSTPARVAPLPVETPPTVFGLDLTAAWWLVGRWVGDGSLTFGRNHEVSICCGFHETDALRERLSDTGAGWSERNLRTAALFMVSDEKARDWLHEHLGHGASRKSLPSFVYAMPRAHRAALLEGYLSADGHQGKRRARVSTTSRALAVSCRLLAESLGYRVAMGRDTRTTYTIEGRTGVALPQWVLHWERRLSAKRAPEAFEDEGMAWSRVRKVGPGREDVTVYNIEVEEDHSYVLDGIVVANCTNHSQAKGRKRVTGQGDLFEKPLPDEAAQRSRATMWDVVRFTEHHRYQAVLVENVVDAYHWPPFQAWLMAMDSLGYEHQLVFLNSMHAQAAGLPAPQSRDRMYVVFHRAGNRRPEVARWQRPRAWCPTCDMEVAAVQSWKPGKKSGRYRQQYVYRCPSAACRNSVVEPGWLPAASIIDWSNLGTRIGDRGKPLADKTRRRIAAGIARYWSPMHLEAGGHTYDAADPKHPQHGDPNAYYRAWSVDEPLRTLHTIESKALAVPVEGRDGKTASPVGQALRTQTTRLETALVVPAGGTWNDDARPSTDPVRTRTTRESDALAFPPFIAELRGGGSTARPTARPLATVTAAGNHHALVTPYYGNSTPTPVSNALPTVTTVDRHALVMRNNSSLGDGAEMVTPATEPVRTITTTGHQSLLTPGDLAAAAAQVDDVMFRMLEPAEVIAAMAFPGSYVVLGNRREQVRMAGNAVTPPAARDLIGAVVESLTGEAVAV